MSDWTELPLEELAPDSVGKSEHAIAFFENTKALAEGAPGAPKIQNEAMGSGSVDNDNLVNGTLGAEKFQTGTDETDWVLGRIAGLSAGAVGTYAMALSSAVNVPFGDLVSGSFLSPSNASGTTTGPSLTGTWRCLGFVGSGASSGDRVTIFLRVS
jgi:hypothetical protein